MKFSSSELSTMRFCAEEMSIDYKDLKKAVINTINYYERKKQEEIQKIKTMADLTDDELLQLRQDICLGSCYLSDYENRFDIDREQVYDFFDGYVEYLEELLEEYNDTHKRQKDDSFEFDSADNLINWYYCIEYDDNYIKEKKQPKIEEIEEYYNEKIEAIFSEEEIYGIAKRYIWNLLNKIAQ